VAHELEIAEGELLAAHGCITEAVIHPRPPSVRR
jgi:hypothetical protein